MLDIPLVNLSCFSSDPKYVVVTIGQDDGRKQGRYEGLLHTPQSSCSLYENIVTLLVPIEYILNISTEQDTLHRPRDDWAACSIYPAEEWT